MIKMGEIVFTIGKKNYCNYFLLKLNTSFSKTIITFMSFFKDCSAYHSASVFLWLATNLLCCCCFLKKDFIYLFLERGEGKGKREREGEKHQCVMASPAPPAGDLAHNLGMCPDWVSNQQPFGSQAMVNPLSYTSQGTVALLK